MYGWLCCHIDGINVTDDITEGRELNDKTWGDVAQEMAPDFEQMSDPEEGRSVDLDDDTTIEVLEGEIVTTSEVAVPDMTEDEARQITNQIRSSAEMLEVLIYRAKVQNAHKALGYSTWDEYTKAEFGVSSSTAYRKAIVGEVALHIESVSGVMPKLSQADAKMIRSSLPEITEAIEKKKKENDVPELSDDEIARILADAQRSIELAEQNNIPNPIENTELSDRMGNLDHEDFAPLENSASGLDTGAGSIGEARRAAAAQHRADAAGAPEFDASHLSPEDIAAIRGGASVTPANTVRSFVEWNNRLPDPVEVARIFRDDSVDSEFVESLPDMLRGISNWVGRFLAEFENGGQ